MSNNAGITIPSGSVFSLSINHLDGSTSTFKASANTDSARGTALSTAVTSMIAGDSLQIAPGDYQIIAPLALLSNTSVRGSGYSTHIYWIAGTADGSASVPKGIFTNADFTNGNTNISLSNLRVDGNGTNVNMPHSHGIVFIKTTQSKVQNCWFENIGKGTFVVGQCNGVSFQACTDCQATDNIADNTCAGFSATSKSSVASERISLINNKSTTLSTGWGIDLTANNSVATANVILNAGDDALNIGGSNNVVSGNRINGAIGGDGIALSLTASDNIVMGNSINASVAFGIQVQSSTNLRNLILANNLNGSFSGSGGSGDYEDIGTGTMFFANNFTTEGFSQIRYRTDGSGTAYTLTATPAAVIFGTTSPSITITQPGSYKLRAYVMLQNNGATYASSRTVTLKVRRTNNTATDVYSTTVITGVLTSITSVLGILTIDCPIYTTNHPNLTGDGLSSDVLTVFASIDVIPTAGTATVNACWIEAERIK